MKHLRNFIGGQFLAPQSGQHFEHRNPATDQVDLMVPESNVADVAQAVQAAKSAFAAWSRTPTEDRARLLEKIAEGIEARAQELAAAESEDQGKPVWLAAQLDIPRAATNFRYFASLVRQSHGMATQMDGRAFNYTLRSPLGVVGLISPWNLPVYLLTWKIAPAIAVGNTVVCKPSEFTSRTAEILGEIIHAAGVPAGVVNIVFGTGAHAGAALVDHPEIKAISFTGGTVTGLKIAESTARNLKKVSLELGGKNPNLIFADCDLDEAVRMTLRSSFLNQGEICLCGSRILVEQSIYSQFLEKFKAAAMALKAGNPSDPDSFLGPLVSRSHFDKVKSYVELAKQEGGTITLGGASPQLAPPFDKGYFLNPTIITGLDHSCRVIQEEIFGPVVTVTPFADEAEAIALANGVKYGLSASVWTQNLTRAHRLAERLDVGTVWINTWMLRDLRLPFGGMKASGMGREGGEHSLEFFTELKTVCVRME